MDTGYSYRAPNTNKSYRNDGKELIPLDIMTQTKSHDNSKSSEHLVRNHSNKNLERSHLSMNAKTNIFNNQIEDIKINQSLTLKSQLNKSVDFKNAANENVQIDSRNESPRASHEFKSEIG